MMFGSETHETIIYRIDVDPAGDKTYPVFRAPNEMTVVRMTVMPLVSQGAGSAVTLALVNRGTSGTATAGTASAALGGTASPLGGGTPATTAPDFDTYDTYLEAGEYLGIELKEEGDGWQSGDAYDVQIDMLPGNAG